MVFLCACFRHPSTPLRDRRNGRAGKRAVSGSFTQRWGGAEIQRFCLLQRPSTLTIHSNRRKRLCHPGRICFSYTGRLDWKLSFTYGPAGLKMELFPDHPTDIKLNSSAMMNELSINKTFAFPLSFTFFSVSSSQYVGILSLITV